MTTVKINGINWTVEFVDETDPDLENHTYIGRTIQWKQRIVVDKNVSFQMKREVLIHELTHATLACQGRYYQNDFTVEDVCEFVGFNLDPILEMVNYIIREENAKKGA